MLPEALYTMQQLIERGGWVMWPLGALSVIALMLIFARAWFWFVTNNPWRLARYEQIGKYLREGNRKAASALVKGDRTVYGRLVAQLMAENPTDAATDDAIEIQRIRLERFMSLLNSIITAAPMLGILGTVSGIIRVSRVFADTNVVTDPAEILPGIGEALLTTVAGLIIALVVLFPFNAFRAQIDRTLGRMITLAAAVQQSADKKNDQ